MKNDGEKKTYNRSLVTRGQYKLCKAIREGKDATETLQKLSHISKYYAKRRDTTMD